uniref:Protein kinase domain-containing protein n=1 Tax=viral metagenome TaxID=1070528 RepID=A0A6C0CM98_9ZZZZ
MDFFKSKNFKSKKMSCERIHYWINENKGNNKLNDIRKDILIQDNKPQDDKTQDDKTQDDKTQDDKTQDDKPQDDKPQDDKPRLIGQFINELNEKTNTLKNTEKKQIPYFKQMGYGDFSVVFSYKENEMYKIHYTDNDRTKEWNTIQILKDIRDKLELENDTLGIKLGIKLSNNILYPLQYGEKYTDYYPRMGAHSTKENSFIVKYALCPSIYHIINENETDSDHDLLFSIMSQYNDIYNLLVNLHEMGYVHNNVRRENMVYCKNTLKLDNFGSIQHLQTKYMDEKYYNSDTNTYNYSDMRDFNFDDRNIYIYAQSDISNLKEDYNKILLEYVKKNIIKKVNGNYVINNKNINEKWLEDSKLYNERLKAIINGRVEQNNDKKKGGKSQKKTKKSIKKRKTRKRRKRTHISNKKIIR